MDARGYGRALRGVGSGGIVITGVYLERFAQHLVGGCPRASEGQRAVWVAVRELCQQHRRRDSAKGSVHIAPCLGTANRGLRGRQHAWLKRAWWRVTPRAEMSVSVFPRGSSPLNKAGAPQRPAQS
eukprot:1194531-Prorocentrum_minimum.AAC.16